ncbi:hypothetical protein D5b_00441 [Faustovirus]|nr:hypothetical protein D5b_00441 [Faustovirus]AMN84478.1 hypothetical protein D6_00067 [Faustovirus]
MCAKLIIFCSLNKTMQIPTEIVDAICRFNTNGFKYTCRRYYAWYKDEMKITLKNVFVRGEYWRPNPDCPRSFSMAWRVVYYKLNPVLTWREFRRGNGTLKRIIISTCRYDKWKINALYYQAHKLDLHQYLVYLQKIALYWRQYHPSFTNIEKLNSRYFLN